MRKNFVLIFLLVLTLTYSSMNVLTLNNTLSADVKKLALVELFTAEWCPPCGRANPDIDELYNEMGGTKFLLLKYHTSAPMLCKFSEERARKYKVTAIPTVVVDGGEKIVGYSDDYKNSLKSIINTSLSKNVDVDISVTGKINGNNINIAANYDKAPSNSILYAIVCEDYHYYKARNGEIIHRFLVKDGKGIPLKTDKGMENFQFTIAPDWAGEMLRCIIFVESSDGAILNSAFHNLDLPEPDLKKPVITVVPSEINLGILRGTDPIKAEVLITNVGDAGAVVSAKSKDAYVTFSENNMQVSAKSQSVLKVLVDPTKLTPNIYNSVIEITSINYSKKINVRFEILQKPQLLLSTDLLDFEKVKRGNKPRLTFDVKNKIKGNIKGNITSNAKWAVVSKRNFDDELTNVGVSLLTKDMKGGLNETTILIESDGGNGEIIVKAEIIAPKLEFNPDEIDFGEVNIDEENLKEAEIKISNKENEDIEVSVSAVPGFCKASEDKFVILKGKEKIIKISLIKNTLELNKKNEGIISINYLEEKKEINVSVYAIESPPKINLTSKELKDDAVSVSLIMGESRKIDIIIANKGGGVLEGTVEIDPQVDWINLTLNKFNLKKNESTKLTISINSKDVKAGIYETKFKFTSAENEYIVPLKLEIVRKKIIIELWIGKNSAVKDGAPAQVDPPPYIKSGTTLVPLRFIAEAFGANVEWQPDVGKGTIVITLDGITIQVEIQNKTAFINKAIYNLTVAPEITKGRTFVPLRFIAEAFGSEVEWFSQEQKIKITY